MRANVVQVAFGCWVEYRAKILQLRQSSLRKMKQGMLVHCFETWADNVAEIVNVRTYCELHNNRPKTAETSAIRVS